MTAFCAVLIALALVGAGVSASEHHTPRSAAVRRQSVKVMTYDMFLSDLLNTKVDKGPWADDVHDHFVISPIWQLPFGRGQRFAPSNAALNKFVEGWEANTIISFNTGFPYTLHLSPDVDLLHQNGYNGQDRPNLTCNPELSHPTAAQWWT